MGRIFIIVGVVFEGYIPGFSEFTLHSELRDHSMWGLGGLMDAGDGTLANCIQDKHFTGGIISMLPNIWAIPGSVQGLLLAVLRGTNRMSAACMTLYLMYYSPALPRVFLGLRWRASHMYHGFTCVDSGLILYLLLANTISSWVFIAIKLVP